MSDGRDQCGQADWRAAGWPGMARGGLPPIRYFADYLFDICHADLTANDIYENGKGNENHKVNGP